MAKSSTKAAMKIDYVQSASNSQSGSLYIYDEVKADQPGSWFSDPVISETSGKAIRDKLKELGDITQLDVHIASNGGSVIEGLAIYAQLKGLTAHKTAYIDGIAASVASVIAMACDEVVMYKPSQMMIHNCSVGMRGYYTAEELRKVADSVDNMSRSAVEAYVDKCGDKCPRNEIEQMMSEETWLLSSEALEKGFCDRIDDGKAAEDAPDEYKQCLDIGTAGLAENASLKAQLAELRQELSELRASAHAEPPKKDPEPDVQGKDKKMIMRALVKALGKVD